MVAVGRPINGISINGLEWLLDDANKPMVFSDKNEAIAFLKAHGTDDTDIEDYVFDTEFSESEMSELEVQGKQKFE
jgi:hypothetical protein